MGEWIVKIKKDFVLRRMGDSWMAVPIGAMAGKVHGLVSLNETAAAIWEILQQEHTEDEVVALLKREYEGDDEAIRQHVCAFADLLREKDMLES